MLQSMRSQTPTILFALVLASASGALAQDVDAGTPEQDAGAPEAEPENKRAPFIKRDGQVADNAQLGGEPTLTGSIEQLDGGSSNLAGPTALNEALQATNLGCPVSGVGQCAFSLAARDLQHSIGTANAALHDITWTFNLQVPEPSTALLLAVGLCLTGLRSRNRRQR